MLLIHATAGPSSIHGIGLIARQFIPMGTHFYQLHPGFDALLSRQFVRSLSPAAIERILWYAYFDHARRVFVLSGDDDRFTNHSVNPNTRHEGDAGYALRDIAPGEEITGDYSHWGGVSPDGNRKILYEGDAQE